MVKTGVVNMRNESPDLNLNSSRIALNSVAASQMSTTSPNGNTAAVA